MSTCFTEQLSCLQRIFGYFIKHIVNQTSLLSDLVRYVKEGISGMKDDVIGYTEPGYGQKEKL